MDDVTVGLKLLDLKDDIQDIVIHESKSKFYNFGIAINLHDIPWTALLDKLKHLNYTYVYVQEEMSPLGFFHAQCFISFKYQRYLNSLKKIFGEGVCIIKETPYRYLDYVKKERTRAANANIFEAGELPKWDLGRKSTHDVFKRMLEAEDRETAIAIAKEDPSRFILSKKAIMSHINEQFTKPLEHTYVAADFTIPLIKFPDDRFTLVFIGATGIGKSHFAMAHFDNPVKIGIKEDYKKIENGDCDGIIMDDVCTNEWKPTTLCRWCDGDEAQTMDVKYGSILIPKNMRRIICLNRESDFWPKDLNVTDDPQCNAREDDLCRAIGRRIVMVHFGRKDLRRNPKRKYADNDANVFKTIRFE